MKKVLTIIASAFLLSACGATSTTTNLQFPDSSLKITPTSYLLSITPSTQNDPLVGLNTKDGQIVIKLYQKETPNTVANFLKKVNSGFYNGLTFHRVIPGFMAQGGDPMGTGNGGGTIKSELNNLPFKKGSLGLARTPDTKEVSNDSQFFICYDDTGCSHLTGDYVNFGEVISGFESLNSINQGDKIISIITTTK
ncbi:peptidylprolyl isomerase [Candidatus Shapirobacteria bacterium]|nr:peptidylprolyl isomerase [Candidatus Shapirobacteria bacterium]